MSHDGFISSSVLNSPLFAHSVENAFSVPRMHSAWKIDYSPTGTELSRRPIIKQAIFSPLKFSGLTILAVENVPRA
jgi:hypothetical protein